MSATSITDSAASDDAYAVAATPVEIADAIWRACQRATAARRADGVQRGHSIDIDGIKPAKTIHTDRIEASSSAHVEARRRVEVRHGVLEPLGRRHDYWC